MSIYLTIKYVTFHVVESKHMTYTGIHLVVVVGGGGGGLQCAIHIRSFVLGYLQNYKEYHGKEIDLL